MPRETIGTTNGQDFFVGSNTPTTEPPRRYTTPAATITDTPAPPPTPDVPAILTPEAFAAGRAGSVDENAIREQTRKNMQATIDAINVNYSNLVSAQEQKGEGFMGQTRAVNARSGLMGSDFGTANMAGQEKANSQATKAIRDEQSLKIAEVNGKIDEIARGEIASKKAEALGNAEAYATYLESAKTEAQGQLSQLAGANVDLSTLDQKRRAYLFKTAGLDEQLGELVYNSMKPKAAKIEYKAEKAADGKILLYGVDPTTGQLKQQRINFDVPEGYDATYVDGQMYFKNATTGDLIPAPMDQSLYTPGYKDYLLSKKEGFTGNYNDYQTVDANRKRSVSVTNNIGGTDLNTKDRAVFNSLVDKANKSPLIAAADRTIILDKSIKDIEADPGNAAKQLNLSYAYIQALDTYQSAVREGELGNLNSIDSKIGSLQGEIQNIQNGQIVRPEVAKQIAAAASNIVSTIKEGAKAADQKFAAQAKVNGSAVETAWNDYRAGFTASYDDPNKGTGGATDNPLGLTPPQ